MRHHLHSTSAVLVPLLISIPTLAHVTNAASGSLTGRLADEQGRPIAGAQVTLANPGQGFRRQLRTDPQGRFRFLNLPFNGYHLEAEEPGLAGLHQDVELRASLPLDLNLVLHPAGAVVVVEERANLVEDHPSSHVDIDRAVIERIPAAVQSRAMEAVLLTTPGFIADENGRFHFRGSHGQITYVVDGIPVSDQVQAAFSNSLDPAQAESLEVVTGGISAEYGGKPVAVVNMTTRSGLGAPGRQGEVFLGAAGGNSFEGGFSLRQGLDGFGYFVSGSASSSDRFLDPVTFGNLHNRGRTGRVSSRFDWLLSDQDTLRFSVSGGRTRREVVNLPSQEAAGQDQTMAATDANASLAWTHLFGPDRSLDASIYYRRAASDLDPGSEPGAGRDFPVWVSQQRTLENQGAQVAGTVRFAGGSTLKAGLQIVAFPLTERFRFAITDQALAADAADPLYAYTPAGGSSFRFEERLRPLLASAYLQNDLHLGDWRLAAGLRLDRYSVRDLVETQLQPRLGLAYSPGGFGTTLRASYDRLLVTPDNENLALATSQRAWDLGPNRGTPVTPLRPELQDSFSYGIEQQLGKQVRLTLEYWHKQSRNAADSEQFVNTGILFPIAADRGLFRGMNARIEWLPTASFSGSLNLGRTRAIFQAPTVGGLQLEPAEHAPGERFLIDHDQKLALQAGVKYETPKWFVQLSGRYDSGLVAGDPAEAAGNPDLAFGIPYLRKDSEGTWRVRPRTIWDLNAGWTLPLEKGRSCLFSVDLLNVFNEKALYNFLSAFGGTHVVPPRIVAARIKFRF
jgi:hypothetical protein